jgi:hypothetical protein
MSTDADTEIAAIFARLKSEVRSLPAVATASGSATAHRAPLPARARADRAWSVTAERPFENPPGGRGRLRGVMAAPVKRVLRKLMRWYVEPVTAHQRTFNLAILTLVDELTERTADDVERLERRLDALEQRLAADRPEPSG